MATSEIIAENFAPAQWLSWPRSSIRIVDWNIGRGLQLRAIIGFLGDTNADIVILQEVDISARRTHHLNVAQEIARKLRLNYVFGREFVELTQGCKKATLHSTAKPRYRHGRYRGRSSLVQTQTASLSGTAWGQNRSVCRDRFPKRLDHLLQPSPRESLE